MLCFRNFPVAKKITDEGELSRFFVEIFFVIEGQKTSWGNISVVSFRNFTVAKKIMDKRGYQDFPSKKFCLTLPRNFVGEHFCAVFGIFSGSEKLYG